MALTPAQILLGVGSFTTYQGLFALTVTTLPKTAIFLRTLSLFPIFLAALAVVKYAVLTTGGGPRHAFLIGLMSIHYLGAAEYILIKRVDSATLSELYSKNSTSSSKENGKADREQTASFGQLVWQALSLSCNARRITTPWAVKNIHARNPPLSRAKFLLHVIPRTALCCLLVDIFTHAPPPEAHLVTVDKQTAWRLWTLTPEDVIFRAICTVMFWLVSYVLIYLAIHVVAIVAVGLGFSSPEFWPHLFGPVTELCSLRGFWGNFWHQRLRSPLTSFSSLLTTSILPIPHGLLSTYTRLILVFILSGLLHHLTDMAQGMPVRQIGSLAFFLMQPLGIMAEDAAQALTKTWPIPRGVKKGLGFLWLWFFLAVTTPTWMFTISRMGQERGFLPLPVAAPLMKLLNVQA